MKNDELRNFLNKPQILSIKKYFPDNFTCLASNYYLATAENSRVIGQQLVQLNTNEDLSKKITWQVVFEDWADVFTVA